MDPSIWRALAKSPKTFGNANDVTNVTNFFFDTLFGPHQSTSWSLQRRAPGVGHLDAREVYGSFAGHS